MPILRNLWSLKARECFKALDEAALRLPVPMSYGKVGGDQRYFVAVLKQISSCWISLSPSLVCHALSSCFPVFLSLCHCFGRIPVAQAKRYDSSSTSLESVGNHPARGYLGCFETAFDNLLGAISDTVPRPWHLRHSDKGPATADSAGENTWRWRSKTLLQFSWLYVLTYLFLFPRNFGMSILLQCLLSTLQVRRNHQ